MIPLGVFSQQFNDVAAPALSCLLPFNADMSGAGAVPFPISDTAVDPQVFGFALTRDDSSPYYTMAPSGTLAMLGGDASSPFFDASQWTSEIVLLGAIKHDNITALVSDRAGFSLTFGTAGFAETLKIQITVDGFIDNHAITMTALGSDLNTRETDIVTGIVDGTNILAGLYMNAATRQVGMFYNSTDLGYLQQDVLGTFEDILVPVGDLFVYNTGFDSTSQDAPVRTLLFELTFSASQMGTGLPAGSVDTCGNTA